MSRILIAGCGYVGTALARELAGLGQDVFALRRAVGVEIPGVSWISADLLRRESLENLPADLDFVVYTAAAGGSSEKAYRRAYVDGARNLLAALGSQGQELRRIFFTSSTGVYGQNAGEWVDEESPTEPRRPTGRILLEAERVFLDSPWPATILRLGGIYGPDRTRLIEQVRHGEAYLGTASPLYTNRIHRDDCAGALAHLMTVPDPQPTYLGVDQEPVLKSEVRNWIAGHLDLPPVPRDADQAVTGKRCRNTRLIESGYELRYPTFRDGYRDLLDPSPAVGRL